MELPRANINALDLELREDRPLRPEKGADRLEHGRPRRGGAGFQALQLVELATDLIEPRREHRAHDVTLEVVATAALVVAVDSADIASTNTVGVAAGVAVGAAKGVVVAAAAGVAGGHRSRRNAFHYLGRCSVRLLPQTCAPRGSSGKTQHANACG